LTSITFAARIASLDLLAVAERYRSASVAQKRRILDEAVEVTGGTDFAEGQLRTLHRKVKDGRYLAAPRLLSVPSRGTAERVHAHEGVGG
jgi:hypothetical protein